AGVRAARRHGRRRVRRDGRAGRPGPRRAPRGPPLRSRAGGGGAGRAGGMIAPVDELPVLDPGQAPPERADAARNRARILAAAAELVAQRGIEHVSMDDVAKAACVGTGTLYRRFGDRAGLALALLDEQ